METIEKTYGDFFITTDRNKIDIVAVHDFLSNHSGWRDDMPFERFKTCVDNSLNFSLFHHHKQIGFARVISDFSIFAYLDDFYVLNDYRGQGLSKKLLDVIISHPNLQNLNRWLLLTSSAHGLYEKYGFAKPLQPELFMELYNPNPFD
ncbi:MAG: GNAT family N-acetyltransferase [Chitinophagaceae bacterium]|nr:GNAT family N-acetyltransferase [Chitinophagaceae bacterium]